MEKMDYIRYITDGIKTVCLNHKRRTAGAETVRSAEAWMAESMKDCVDEIRTQQFEIHPQAFLASVPLEAFLCMIACALFLVGVYAGRAWAYMVSLVFMITAMMVLIAEYALYRQPMDPFYPAHTGQNLYMVRRAKGTSKRRIILCGHADAAYEMPLLKYFPAAVIYICIGAGVLYWIVHFLFCNLALAEFLPEAVLRIFAVIEIVLTVLYAPLLILVDWRTVVDGANDNLTGCFLSMSILKEMADRDQRFEDTDVCCLITDGEEAGLRGARAFATANVEELMKINTMVIAVDTIHSKEELRIFSRGINYTESNSEEACNLLYFAGMKNGLDLRTAEFYPGACDSEAFSVVGVKAAAICGVAFTPQDYYHNVKDTYTNLNPDCIRLVRDILQDAVTMFANVGHIF